MVAGRGRLALPPSLSLLQAPPSCSPRMKLTRNTGPIGLKINFEMFSAEANQKPRTNRVKINMKFFQLKLTRNAGPIGLR
jgi:hypothetical protein